MANRKQVADIIPIFRGGFEVWAEAYPGEANIHDRGYSCFGVFGSIEAAKRYARENLDCTPRTAASIF